MAWQNSLGSEVVVLMAMLSCRGLCGKTMFLGSRNALLPRVSCTQGVQNCCD